MLRVVQLLWVGCAIEVRFIDASFFFVVHAAYSLLEAPSIYFLASEHAVSIQSPNSQLKEPVLGCLIFIIYQAWAYSLSAYTYTTLTQSTAGTQVLIALFFGLF